MSPSNLSPPPTLLRPEVGIFAALTCLALDELPPYGAPVSGGIL